jgi:hypothetical protein
VVEREPAVAALVVGEATDQSRLDGAAPAGEALGGVIARGEALLRHGDAPGSPGPVRCCSRPLHDAPVPLLEDLVFHGPSLRDAWVVARLDTTVLLHLKQGSGRYLDELQPFLEARALQRTIVQTKNPGTLRTLRQTMPSVQRLLLIFTAQELAALRADEQLLT